MKTEIYVAPEFSFLEKFIQQVPQNFLTLGDEIYSGRNDVRLVSVDGLIIAIKYFKRITLANRYIFATVRKSKARRAFEHSELLINRGITSPKPVAYINSYRYGMLDKSYYVSLYTDYKPLEELLKLPVSQSEETLRSLARFICRVHKSGVFHKDLTLSNILYRFEDNQYDFSLIDNNRMKFGNYSFKKGMDNLKRMSLPVESHGIIAAEYAREAGVSDIETLRAMIFFRWRFLLKQSLRKCLKAPFRNLPGIRHGSSYIVRKETNLLSK